MLYKLTLVILMTMVLIGCQPKNQAGDHCSCSLSVGTDQIKADFFPEQIVFDKEKYPLSAFQKSLQELDEFSLVRYDASEVYRITFIPSFHDRMVIRLWPLGDKVCVEVKRAVRVPDKFTESYNKQPSYTACLSQEDWNKLGIKDNSVLWEAPPVIQTNIPDDGSWLVLELRKGQSYHVVIRNGGGEVWYKELCSKVLVEIGKYDPKILGLYLPSGPGSSPAPLKPQ